MSLLAITVLAIIVNLVLGLFIILKNPKSTTHRLFFIFAVTNAIWALFNYLSLRPPLDSSAIFWIRSHLAVSTFHASVFLLLIINFPKHGLAINKRKLIPYMGLVLVTMLATLSPYVFRQVINSGQTSLSTQPGILMPLFAVVAFGSITLGLVTLVRKFSRSHGKQREQLRYILLGTSMMFALVFFCIFIPVAVFQSGFFTAYLPAFTFPFVLTTAYAITRHNLFDIRPIIARSVAYTLLLTILTVTYIGAIFGVSNLFYQGQVSGDRMVVYAILTLFVAVTYQPLKVKLERVTNKVFYKNSYSSNELISNITSIMAETLMLEELAHDSLSQILNTMHISNGSLWILENDHPIRISAQGYNRSNQVTASYDDLCKLGQGDHIAVLDEQSSDGHHRILRSLSSAAAVPLFAGDVLQGILLLGDKKSGEIYTEKDLNVLRILGPGLATALDNARSYKQISEFNQTLKSEIEIATKDLQVANEKLYKNNEKLRQLDELKDEFISVTSHELRTPLTSIKGYLWMAMHGKSRDDKFHDYMNKAYASTERLITMVNDTLDVSRIESGRVELSVEPTNLNRLAQDVVDDLIDRANQQHQQLILKRTRALPLVDCDPTKIYQVLTNLVGNALKFTPAGGKIKVDFTHRGNHVMVRVQDNGPGISVANQEKLFQKFSRLETTIPGTGLGLYLCMQIIKLSKGKIWIESQEGRGAAFIFTLPASKTQTIKTANHPQQFRNIA